MSENFAALFEETRRRYGRNIGGFAYIDDGFFRAYQHDPPWEKWFRAIKAGNPNALVGFSPSRGPNVTPFNDLQVGDFGTTLPEPSPSRMFAPGEPREGLHPGWYIAMDGWRTRQPFQGQFHEQPRFSKEQCIGYFRRMGAERPGYYKFDHYAGRHAGASFLKSEVPGYHAGDPEVRVGMKIKLEPSCRH
jgi:hypothetical protein